MYSKDLVAYRIEDIAKACEQIGLAPRRDGESAFPDIGTLLAAVEESARNRSRAKKAEVFDVTEYMKLVRENPEQFVRWTHDPEYKQLLKRYEVHYKN